MAIARSGPIPFDLPQPANVNLLMQPLMQGMQTYRQGMQQQFEGERALNQERINNRKLQMAEEEMSAKREREQVERLGNMAQVIDGMADPQQRQAAWGRLRSSVPNFDATAAKHGLDPNDHMAGPKFLMAEVGKYMTPAQAEMEQAKLAQVKAQTANIGADSYAAGDGFIYNKRTGAVQALPEGVGNTKTSLQPIWGQDAQGNLVPMQPNSRGEAVATKLPPGITPTKGVQKIDLGTHFAIINQMTGQTIGVIPKDVEGKEAAEARGQAAGKAQANLPVAENNAARALDTIEAIRKHPGKQYGVGAIGVVPGIPGTQQRGFVNLVNQAKGQAFLQAFDALRGAGAITEKEGEAATLALSRLDRAQTPEDFDQALVDLENIIKRGISTARLMAKTKNPAQIRATPADQQAQQPSTPNGWSIRRLD